MRPKCVSFFFEIHFNIILFILTFFQTDKFVEIFLRIIFPVCATGTAYPIIRVMQTLIENTDNTTANYAYLSIVI
jgi:hypothetical protein